MGSFLTLLGVGWDVDMLETRFQLSCGNAWSCKCHSSADLARLEGRASVLAGSFGERSLNTAAGWSSLFFTAKALVPFDLSFDMSDMS